MKNIYIIVLALIIILGGIVWYVSAHPQQASQPATVSVTTNTPAPTQPQTPAASPATYHYECDEHVTFSMTPASDLASIHVAADSGAYPPASTLLKKSSASGARYEGNGVVLTGKGQTVVLGEGDSAINCSPAANITGPVFNFGG